MSDMSHPVATKPAQKSGQRIGLWGGSFNPPTLAHKSLSDYAFSVLNLDLLYWIVSPHNPEKDAATLAPFPDRLAMVTQLLESQPDRVATDIEEKQGSSYTIDTVRKFRQERPDDHLFFLMGTDNWLGFHLWGGYAEIMENVSIIVLQRPGGKTIEDAESTKIFADNRVDAPEKLGKSKSWYVLDNPVSAISATQARQELKEKNTSDILAPETLRYIREHGLYGE